MLTQNIRRDFLSYFKSKHHALIPSSPVIPHDDSTLLFINAGMNQFKDVFLGKSERDYKRAATSQKCIRVGGKHNDLDNVGHTRRHLTFFEMIGNFSFGDYFKADAIKFAWEVATQVFHLNPDKIWPTVFRDDDEAFNLWTLYVPKEKITRFGEKDNFWAMGDTGPCGPCSELLYDRGESYGKATKPSEDTSGERFLEFWNLVFMQYNRQPDGKLIPLPKPSIDTGAGLERIMSLKMNVGSVFETDILRALISKIEHLSGKKYENNGEGINAAFRVIADHLRCLAFAIADGVQPSNVDRGYVLRKVLRRAVRYGKTLGLEEPFLANILPVLIEKMGEDYPEIRAAQNRIAEILTHEEEAFIRTLKRGGNILNTVIEKAQKEAKTISGDDAFKLKDTYGFPLEEVILLAKDVDLTVDIERYNLLEQEAKERSRHAHKTTHQIASENVFAKVVETNGITQFVGYNQHQTTSIITGILVDEHFEKEIEAGKEALILLDKTPFYAEMGGQVGDTGTLSSSAASFQVAECRSPFKGVTAHIGKVEKGTLRLGDEVEAAIDSSRRQQIGKNHTATHLLHWALQKILGSHIKQAGSIVEASRLRFDFSHHKALTENEIYQIEDLINEKIRENQTVKTYEIAFEDAQKKQEIKQFFGEKYGAVVRVVDLGYSQELCGGTHSNAVGELGFFIITKESSIAAGIRRIEAVTGSEAEQFARESAIKINKLSHLLKTTPPLLVGKIEKLLEENKELTAQIESGKKKELGNLASNLIKNMEKINNISLVAAEVSLNAENLKKVADETLLQLNNGIVVLGAKWDDKCHILVRINEELTSKGIKATDFIKALAPLVEGTGGGKANSAQTGGKAPHKLNDALIKARKLADELTKELS